MGGSSIIVCFFRVRVGGVCVLNEPDKADKGVGWFFCFWAWVEFLGQGLCLVISVWFGSVCHCNNETIRTNFVAL